MTPVPSIVTCDAVLFDMDGTLVDSTAVVERQWGRWAARRGVDLDAILAVSHGRPTLETLSLVAPQWATAEEAAALEASEPDDDEGVVAVGGAQALITTLPASRWAVVTSAGRSLARARLAAAGLRVPPVLVTSNDVPRGKPDPAGYLEAARQLGVRPDRCVVFEDAPVGVAAGLAAGATVIGMTTTFPMLDGCAHRVRDFSTLRVIDTASAINLEIGASTADCSECA
jgi:sugar-phosphatase